jgi:hypothetical protein
MSGGAGAADVRSGMTAVDPEPWQARGLDLLLMHCRALDYDRPNAAERLEQELGPDLTHMLLFALDGCGRDTRARAA